MCSEKNFSHRNKKASDDEEANKRDQYYEKIRPLEYSGVPGCCGGWEKFFSALNTWTLWL